MRSRPDSKAARARAADKLLRLLLRTPKTRSGLIAAVTAKGTVSKHLVFGWLAENTRNGTVTVFKGNGQLTYQITESVVVEPLKEGDFPAWLEPRTLPLAQGREVFISGQRTTTIKDKDS